MHTLSSHVLWRTAVLQSVLDQQESPIRPMEIKINVKTIFYNNKKKEKNLVKSSCYYQIFGSSYVKYVIFEGVAL